MQRILVPVDFSPDTSAVIEEACRLAKATGGSILLLHVAAPDPDFVSYGAGPPTVRAQAAHHLHEARVELERRTAQIQARGIRVDPVLLRGPTIATIIEHAGKVDTDLIVVGSHGRGALGRLALGSVSEGLLRQARRPVLVVPPGWRGSRPADAPSP